MNVVSALAVYDCAAALLTGLSILDNARAHVDSNFLLRMDFVDFFTSITEDDIANYIRARSDFFKGWTLKDKSVFSQLVCRKAALTVGAPTSPALSNAICFELDDRLHQICTRDGVTYTRYADDLFFSTSKKDTLRSVERQVIRLVKALRLPSNLVINAAKTRHSSKRGARWVTGVVLGSDGRVHLGRFLKRVIRSRIYNFQKLTDPEKASLAGMVAYAVGLDPDFENSLILKYGVKRVRDVMTSRP